MENVELINEDCMEYLPMIEDASVDLVILDPDYNLWKDLCRMGLICQAVRILKPTGNLIMFTKQPFDFDLRCEIDHIFRREFVWTFTNGGAWVSNRMPLVSTQKIYWCTIDKNFYFNPRTGQAYNDKTKETFKRKTKVFEGYYEEGRVFEKSQEGTWIRDHFHFNKPNTGRIPSKPKELIDILIRCFSKNNDIVVDPFMGSGTIGKSCAEQGRRYIGMEIDESRYNLAVKSIKNAHPCLDAECNN